MPTTVFDYATPYFCWTWPTLKKETQKMGFSAKREDPEELEAIAQEVVDYKDSHRVFGRNVVSMYVFLLGKRWWLWKVMASCIGGISFLSFSQMFSSFGSHFFPRKPPPGDSQEELWLHKQELEGSWLRFRWFKYFTTDNWFRKNSRIIYMYYTNINFYMISIKLLLQGRSVEVGGPITAVSLFWRFCVF